jgi:hypothetical protein
MFCNKCGKKAGDHDKFCVACGARLVSLTSTEGKPVESAEEKTLLSFGPLGVMVTYGRPSIGSWTYNNTTLVEVTDKKIVGIIDKKLFPLSALAVAIFSAGSQKNYRFVVPYRSIVAVESFNYLVSTVLYIKYTEGGNEKEVSVYGLNGGIPEAYRLVKQWRIVESGH